jgi:hypothetical protein
MASTFAYGLRAGASVPLLITLNVVAILIDMMLFFAPTYVLSDRLHAMLRARMSGSYDRGLEIVGRVGALRTATALAFILPSVVAMITVGLLRLQFWRAALGIFIGSSVYVVIPLLIAVPLSAALPPYLLSLLPWSPPVIGVVLIAVWLVRSSRHGGEAADTSKDGTAA